MRAGFLSVSRYTPPPWARTLPNIPSHRYNLSVVPTPVMEWHVQGLPPNMKLFVKRDDLSGFELSGNKVRKLEFLMADVKANGYDCVVTIGGIQSNHCRATAMACRFLGIDSHLILRIDDGKDKKSDPGYVGNLLLNRLVGAHIWEVTREEYAYHGSTKLLETVASKLSAKGRKPYIIPVGGSNWLGTWGYIDAVQEICEQIQKDELFRGRPITDIVMATGSGGTTAGVALGMHLSKMGVKVHGFSVCDNPDYFYRFIDKVIFQQNGENQGVPYKSRDLIDITDVKGKGYAKSRPEELKMISEIAAETGIILDPVYSGKAMYGFLKKLREQPKSFNGKNILFLHTGGVFGLYDKMDELSEFVPNNVHSVFEDGLSKSKL